MILLTLLENYTISYIMKCLLVRDNTLEVCGGVGT